LNSPRTINGGHLNLITLEHPGHLSLS